MKNKVLIFGGTGSIGTQALEVIKQDKNLSCCGFSYLSNDKLASKLKNKYKIKNVLKVDKKFNKKQINNFIKLTKPDIILNAVSGFSGLFYSLVCIDNKIDLALANKESLVVAGQFIVEKARSHKVHIYPVDSEHSALYQLINNKWKRPIYTHYITASGGMFWEKNKQELEKATYSQAIKNPNWKMGEKVSIDSSTLINKAFEIVEAYWLFNHIKVNTFVQRQSKIHALVQYEDNSFGVYQSKADMKQCIKLALNKYKFKDDNIVHYSDFKDIKYPLLKVNNKYLRGYEYASLMLRNIKKAIPIIINAADEEAIKLFKSNKIKFLDIYSSIDLAVKKFKHTKISNISDVIKLDKEVRNFINSKVWLSFYF